MSKTQNKELTARQQEVYDKIKNETLRTNRIQTFADASKYLGITPFAVKDHIRLMAKKGYVTQIKFKAGIYLKCLRIVEVNE